MIFQIQRLDFTKNCSISIVKLLFYISHDSQKKMKKAENGEKELKDARAERRVIGLASVPEDNWAPG